LNLTPVELDDLTPREFGNKLVGFEEIHEIRQRESWEMFRMLASTNMIPHTAKGKQTKPTDLWSFHWDSKPDKIERKTSEEIAYIAAKRKLQRDGNK
tara:strand:- start:4614 stop:4904 length:291 start_codon:yes stop_codon:yes gene_type:complete